MAESRRVPLTTLSCDLPSSSVQTQKCPSWTGILPGEENRPHGTANTDTVRLVLTLSEADEQSFPEFSYSQLIENKIKHSNNKVPLSKFEEEKRETDEIASITRKLEAKYGGKAEKKKDRIQDLIDIGYGYDDEDSFIDNSEAYDEFVPAAITTKFGGFYINSGVLQFRQVSDSETENFTTETILELSKKRKVNDGQEKLKKKRKEDEEKNVNMEARLSTLSDNGLNDEMKRKKKKRVVGTLSVTSMLKKFQREKEKERQKMEKAKQKVAGIPRVPTIPLCPADAAGGGGSGMTDPLLSLIGSINDHALIQAASTVDFDIDLVSLLDATEETLSPKLVPQPATETQLIQPKTNNPNDAQARPSNTKTNSLPKIQPEQPQPQSEASSCSSHQCVPLPEGLTPGLEEAVKKLMMAVKMSEGESKLKFFTPEINSILLDIELQCREQGGPLRSKLYTHLSSFLPCSRDTLLKRIKKLLLTRMEEPPDMEDSVQKLSEAIGKAMPEQIACYQANCQAYEQLKASKATEEATEGKPSEDNVEEKGVTRGGPKKVFRWNEEIRECLCDVLRAKMDKYEKERSESQEVEEYLKTLLDSEVKPLWPKGWMLSRTLMRESRKLLGSFASLPGKKAKQDKKQSSTIGTSGAPPLEVQVPQKTNDIVEGSSISMFIPPDATTKEAAAPPKKNEGATVAAAAAASTPISTQPSLSASAAPSHSPLELLADQALARGQPLMVPQEILAAAIIKYKLSGQHWNSFGVNMKSPPPPPQSSPVGFPEFRVCQSVLPQLLQTGDFAKNLEAEQVQRMSDDSVIIIP
ncbi:ubinuclein-1-like isoform X1 [Solea solea]|uniref:ubinuclein-1-like isoform X1 n=1 Tax=Solea solea TaxID=90069 RepID=UPI00272CD0A3|nr:ubinuclein-1-like isoform X1 [Solea solea]